jgi:hypothetical protein
MFRQISGGMGVGVALLVVSVVMGDPLRWGPAVRALIVDFCGAMASTTHWRT